MSKTPKRPTRSSYRSLPAAMEETLRLYHAWLGYLLTLLRADTLRVKVGDIQTALEDFSCAVTREGDEYVIRLSQAGKEDADDGCTATQS